MIVDQKLWRTPDLFRVGVFVTFGLVHAAFGGALAEPTPADRFVEAVQADKTIPDEARKLIRDTWADCDGCDGDEFMTQGLVVLSTEFRQALDAYDVADYATCTRAMGSLRNNPNLFLSTNAAVYEIKALVAAERLQKAGHQIESLLADGGLDLSGYTYFMGEIAFLRGYCLLADLNYQEAELALSGFMKDNPSAPQRLRITAEQMLGELRNRQPGRIGEVVDFMGFARRRLADRDAGETVQARQQRIVELLDRLIDEAEKQEKSDSSGQNSGGQKSGKSQSSKGKPSQKPMSDSKRVSGRSDIGELRNRRRASPADTWGQLPPAQRDQILQALRDSFPSRYRQLVEQYYAELARKP